MKIICAITPSQLEKLYKHVTLSMQEARSKNKTFDPNSYMDDLFNKIRKKSGTDTAVKFLQPVPIMIFKAYTTIPNYVDDVVLDIDPVIRLNRLFSDELTGMRNVLKTFAPSENQSVLKEAIFKTQLLGSQIPLTEIEKIEPFRFEPMNVFSTTFQQFNPVDVQQLDKNLIQKSSEERALFYKIFDRLHAEGQQENLTEDIIYQGKKLSLKPVKLTEINQDDLDGVTKSYLVKALSIAKQGTAKESVIKPNEIIVTVLADENGNFVRFDSQGNISDQGKIVYQMMRNVITKNKKFVPVNFYGYPTFGSVVARIERDYEISNEAAEKIFQQQLKALHTLRKKILAGEIEKLSITGFSSGIEADFTQKNLKIKHLANFGLVNAIRTIAPVKQKGAYQATITLKDQQFNINRPYLDQATAEKIAEVLVNKDLSYIEKKSYVQQFLANTSNPKLVRHNFLFLDTNKTIKVTYFDKTYEQDNFRKAVELDLNNVASKDKIIDALTRATSDKQGNFYPVAGIYNEDLLNTDAFIDYNIETGKFVKADISYSTYLSNLEGGAIDLSSANTEEVFNQYINFAIPSKIITQLNKAQEEEASEVRKRKDAIVDYIKKSDAPVVVEIEKVRSGTFEGEPYVNAFFKSPVDNSETKIRVKQGEVKEGDRATLFLETETTEDMYIPDKIMAVIDGTPIGAVEETDYKKEKPRTELYKRLFKNRQKKSIDEQIDDATTDENANNPNKGGLSSRFGFDRSGKLPADPGTKEQNKKAMEWWEKSELSKYLDLETGVNIVNSDAFGRWVSYGAVLSGKYGKVIISKKGTAVDIYHEAWHGFTQLFLTPKERKALYQELKRSLKGTKGLSYFELEEYLAEEFRKYAKNPKAKKNSPKRNSIFRRILNFLKKLLGVGYTTNPLEIKKVREMFETLYYNKGLNNYNPSIDNVQFDVLERNIGITVPGTDKQVLTRQESLLVKSSIDSIISDIVDEVAEDIKQNNPANSKGVALNMILDPKKKAILYEVVKERLQEKLDVFKEKRDTLEDTLENEFEIDQLNENIRVLERALNNYGDANNGTIKFHLDNSTYKILVDTYVEDELNADEEKTIEDSEKFGDKKVGDKSLLEFAGKETLYMLKSLHEVKNGKTVENQLGFKKLADFRLTWNNVVRTIAGESDPQVMYDKLVEASKQYEPFKQLTESKLPNPKLASSNVFDFKATTSFWQDFNKTRVPYIQLTLFGSGENITAKVLNASLDTKNILRNFNTKYKADQDNTYVIIDPSTANVELNLEKVVADFGKNGVLDGTRAVDFARAIGIYVDDIETIRKELNSQKGVPNPQAEQYGLSFMYRALFDIYNNISSKTLSTKDVNELKAFLQDPVSGFYTGVSKNLTGKKESKQYTQLNRLAQLQGRFGEAANIFGVLNAEGNIVYEYIENNTVSTRTRSMNVADDFNELIDSDMNPMSYLSPDKNTFTSKSVILRSLFSLNSSATSGTKIQDAHLELFLDSGTTREFGDGTNTSNLDETGKFLQEFHMMLIDGTQEFIRAASKKAAFGLRFRGSVRDKLGKPINSKGSNLYVELDKFKDDFRGTVNMINDEFMIGYLASEANRIHKFVNNKEEFKNYTGFNKPLPNGRLAGESFTIFDDILGIELDTGNDLRQEIYDIIDSKKDEVFDLEDYLTKHPGLTQRIKKQMNQYFTSKISEVYRIISKPNILLSKDILQKVADIESDSDKRKYLAAAYYYNSWIHNFETTNLIEGDISQYNHLKEELSKRSPGTKSGGKTFRTDVAAQKFINSESFKAGSYAVQANKSKTFRYDGTMGTAVMQDIKRDSIYIPEIKKGLEEYYGKTIKNKTRVDTLVANDISKYEKMEEGDGQGWITFDAYRALKFLENDWSYEQEELFNKIARGEKVNTRDVVELFPPYKLFYSGSIKEAMLPMTSVHKFSLMPLIPSVIKGSDLESLHDQMIDQDIAYSLFSTGSKISHISSNGTADVIYNDDIQKDIKTDIQFTRNTIYVDYLKNVTNVPKKLKKKTIYSTQFRKLILKDLYNRGIITDPKAKSAAEKYNTLIDAYMQILEQQLLDEIGYKKVDGKYIGNIENFLDLVQRELGRRNVPEHQITFVGENVNKTLKTDLSFHFKAGDIEKMIVGVIEKRLIKQRVKGESLVQVSSAMTNGLWGNSPNFTKASDEQVRKYLGTNNLPFYTKKADGSTAAMKVAIAMQGDFTNLYNVKDKDGESIKVFDEVETVDDAGNTVKTRVFNEAATLANLNQLIKDEDWLNADNGKNRKLITMTAVRIPVQGINSMEFMEVHEFLPAEAGNILIPPTEIVAKSGSDFDIDKLSVFMPNIDSAGELVKYDLSIEETKDVLDISKDETRRKIANTKKKAIENEIIETVVEILALESNYPNLVRPNSTFLVKEEIADQIADRVSEYNRYQNVNQPVKLNADGDKVISPTASIDPLYQVQKHAENMIAKRVLGIVAIENALSVIINTSKNGKMPKTYKQEGKWDHTQRRYNLTDIDRDMRLFLPHNQFPDGAISISDIIAKDGNNIGELYSQILNGFVDIEKDPWVFNIQGNYEVIPILLYLIKAGVPIKSAVSFVSNPFVREYAKKQRELKSSYSTEGLDPRFVKYQAAGRTIQELALQENRPGSTRTFEKRDPWSGQPTGEIITVYDYVTNEKYYDTISKRMRDKSEFTTADLREVMTGDVLENPRTNNLALNMFLHFLEIEKQIKGISSLKRESNPDTTRSKTVQELLIRESNYDGLSDITKINQNLVNDMRTESILSSFRIADLIKNIVNPVFEFRNNEIVTEFLERKLKIYGGTKDEKALMITRFKDGIMDYIFQNYQNSFVDSEGNLTTNPDSYLGFPVKSKKGITKGVEVDQTKQVVYIDNSQIEKDFKSKIYTSKKIKERGLRPVAKDVFRNVVEYKKYVIAREYLRSIWSKESISKDGDFIKFKNYFKDSLNMSEEAASDQAYEAFLNREALFDSFNRATIMGTGEFSYAQTMIDLIKDNPTLKNKYEILSQFYIPKQFGKTDKNIKVLSLKNIREVKRESDLGDIYHNNLKDLADPTVQKVSDPQENLRISRMFAKLPLISVYQHGVGGYNTQSIIDVLPYSNFLNIMNIASEKFLDKQLNEETLGAIYKKILLNRGRFIDYTADPEKYEPPVQPDIKLGPRVTINLNKFSQELSDKIEKVLREKYPEITLNFTNKPIDFDDDSDVFNQEVYNMDRSSRNIIGDLLYPLRKANQQFEYLSKKDKMSILATIDAAIKNDPLKYVKVINNIPQINIQPLAYLLLDTFGNKIVSEEAKDYIKEIELEEKQVSDPYDSIYDKTYEKLVKEEARIEEGVSDSLNKIRTSLDSSKNLFGTLVNTYNAWSEFKGDKFMTFSLMGKDNQKFEYDFKNGKLNYIGYYVLVKDDIFGVTQELRSAEENSSEWIDAQVALKKFKSDPERIKKAINKLLFEQLEKQRLTIQFSKYHPDKRAKLLQEEVDFQAGMFYESTRSKDDIEAVDVARLAAHVLIANNITDEYGKLIKQFGVKANTLLKLTKNKEYTSLKKRQTDIKYILANKEKFEKDDLDPGEFFGSIEDAIDAGVIAPIPGWFINAVSVMNTGLFFDKLDVGRFVEDSLKPLIVIAAEAQWENRLLAQPEFEKLAESTNLNNRLTDRLVYGSKNNVFSDLYLLNQTYKNKIIGQANIKAMTVLVDAVNQKQDTLPHEYAHHYIAYFRDTPIVQEGIKRFGGEEALVQAIGEQVVAQEGEAYNWWQKFTKWLLNLLSDKQVLQILTDSFLTRTDLATDFQYATEAPAADEVENTFPKNYITSSKNIFSVEPIQAADKKAKAKAKIATQYIGFAEGIKGSSTALYAKQAGKYANTGNYGVNDVIFVSVPGKRGSIELQKQNQDRTISEAVKAVEAGATIITDNKVYIDANSYNTGEKILYDVMLGGGYKYSEVTVDGQILGTWHKSTGDTDITPSTYLPPGNIRLEFDSDGKLRGRKEDLAKFVEDYEKMMYGPDGKPPINRTGNVC